jgi:hypothetical protein
MDGGAIRGKLMNLGKRVQDLRRKRGLSTGELGDSYPDDEGIYQSAGTQ